MIFFELEFTDFYGDVIVIRRLESCVAVGVRNAENDRTEWIFDFGSLESALEFLYDRCHLQNYSLLTFEYKSRSNGE